ncbi:BTAD domain-containing putative transcriptional regulator [[Mycobacterium] vasticus]|uniref:BTAD domain-containing putative transcriptional regulator n=2 Tax=[Mycobacterium] vasticus TaxID=2875777 RepID=A0ABU5YRR8_9MYCO|nr:BTAD domain-containing putative transcriptional regulator [Mycolicibacter sp. MYC017]MEB3067809.1 BTAD domain-containing putative transcriptional regulator [Mycolicibacter sp. MYC017]
MELGVLGPLQARRDGAPVTIPGAKPRAILTMLGLHGGSVVSAESLIDLLWGDDAPRTAVKALQTHISALRRALGDGFVITEGMGWILSTTEVDASRYKLATKTGRDAVARGDIPQAVASFDEALALWRGTPELPDSRRGLSEKTRWLEGHAAMVEDRADALLATGRAAELIGELEAAVGDAPLRERRWGQLMLALYRAGRQGEALGAYQRARSLLADELGVDPGPELRRLEAAIVAQDTALEYPVGQHPSPVTRAVTFLLTDIEGSTAAWEADANAMALALARHDELAEQVVTSRGGRLIKTRGEGDATFSVFERPSAAAAAALELQDAILHEPWALREPMRIRIALHTGEVELRDGDYFGRAVNRAARLRSLAVGGQILCSGATAELVIDALPDDVMLADLGMRQLRNLPRPEHVFELRLEAAERPEETSDAPLQRPDLPAILTGPGGSARLDGGEAKLGPPHEPGPFVGRSRELERLASAWQTTLTDGIHAVLISGEPGIGKTRLAGEWSRQAYEYGAVVLYGRSDEDLGAPYQPFAEALRSLVPCVEPKRLRGLRGLEALLSLVPGLADVLPDLVAPPRADPDTERYALFDAAVALLELASASAPVVLILDDLHWAAKPTLLLLRHLLRFGDHTRLQVVATYRSTDLDRSHPLAAMLADLHRDGTADRLQLSGLDEDDVTAYVTEAGHDDEELAHALASVTGGNPFFLIQALRHVAESGGIWDPSTLPQGVREAVSRRLSRLPAETNKALAAAAVVGSHFALEFVERVVDKDLVDAFDEARQAGIVVEEPGGRYRFNHAIVRQSLLAELASVRRMRLHQRIAATLEAQPGADDDLLAELAYHYFECAWAGNAAKAVEYCRRAADQAMARLAYEGAADLYDHALHALDEIDEELPDRGEQVAELLIARCEALLAAGDVTSAAGAVEQLQAATINSDRLAAWATCFDGQLSMLIHPERLDDVEVTVGQAAGRLAEIADAAGEAKAHTVRAGCLARLGRIGDCEDALDDALTAARRAGEHRRVNAVLANAPLAALWGPNPVPRAGGRCLDVVRLLRITTDSPAVESTSTRCQALLEAFRGRTEAARRMIDSARRTINELGLRHALLEVGQFAGMVELVADDPGAAEPHLRKAYHGFRRMGLDADTAETAAMLGRACLALDRDAEAAELCSESERLAGHALKASISWRTLRALLLARRGEHDEARRMAQSAVGLAERTDLLVDHGDACLALATVLNAAGDTAGARAAAEQSLGLYERKGAGALADMARLVLGERVAPPAEAPTEAPAITLDTACVRVGDRLIAAVDRGSWDEFEQMFAPDATLESRRKIVGFKPIDLPSDWVHQNRLILETGGARVTWVVMAVRGERLALGRLTMHTADESPGAPQDEFLQLYGIDDQGRVALQIWFDVDDMDTALAELDAVYAQSEEARLSRLPKNAATRLLEQYDGRFVARDWDAMAGTLDYDFVSDDRRRVANAGVRYGRDAEIANMLSFAEIGILSIAPAAIATRGERLVLCRHQVLLRDWAEPSGDVIGVVEINTDNQISAHVMFDGADIGAAFEELDARYLAGEAAAYAHTWSLVTQVIAALNRRELFPTTPDWVNIDHRQVITIPSGDLFANLRAAWDAIPQSSYYVEAVHRINDFGIVVTHSASGISQEGFFAEWRTITVITFEGDLVNRCEVYDEAGLYAAIVRFDQLGRPAPRLENAAARVYRRNLANCAAHDWDALSKALAQNIIEDDRRRMANAGLRRGRDAVTAGNRALAELGGTLTVDTIAIRGEHLALSHGRASTGQSPDDFHGDFLDVAEVDAAEQVVAHVIFEADDVDAAIAELDARYLAGDAAAYARTWSVITGAYASITRHEFPAMTPGCVTVDHRRAAAFASGELPEYIRAGWDLDQSIRIFVQVVHRLSELGAVCTYTAHGVSRDGFAGEWREIALTTVDGDMVNRCEMFDETDLDAALARFEKLRPQPCCPENAASRVYERFRAYFGASDWDAVAKILVDDVSTEDRRRLVGSDVRRGRDAAISELSALSTGTRNHTLTSEVLATRGSRLLLVRSRYCAGDDQATYYIDGLETVEIDADERLVARIAFDPDAVDAALAELDARYLAGEAAGHSDVWSTVAASYAALNRHELPLTTPDCVNIDHRREMAFGPGDVTAYIQGGRDTGQDIDIYVEQVHRLSGMGTVVTYVAQETSHEGLAAEWRGVAVFTVNGEKINRTEVFDESDLDAALARFDELSAPTLRLGNAASRLASRFEVAFAARDWDAMAELLTDDTATDDRRPLMGVGVRRGRDTVIADWQAAADVGVKNLTSAVIATRGEHLVLSRYRFAGNDQRPGAFHTDVLGIIETDDNQRIASTVMFDLDEIEVAFAELDTRYLVGEAAAHARTWSVIGEVHAAYSRNELPAEDWISVDHRRGTPFVTGDVTAVIRAWREVTPDFSMHIEAVHRLDNVGAVVTHASCGTSAEGFDAEWRMIQLLTVDGARIDRCEMFDESDLDAALARFDELSAQTRQLENAATRACACAADAYNRRDGAALFALTSADSRLDDRRKGLRDTHEGAEVQKVVAVTLETTPGSWRMEIRPIATRGSRLALTRRSYRDSDDPDRALTVDLLSVVEVGADGLMNHTVTFDPEDFDAAVAELDARYLAGEAAAHAHTWSIIMGAYAALNRREIAPTTPDWVNIDHRRGAAFEPGDMVPYLQAAWDDSPDTRMYIAAVHRLSDIGAVVTHVAHGMSQEGFDAEWRDVVLFTVDGDVFGRCEIFEESDVDAALARFDELSRPAPRLQNAASRMYVRFNACLAARDWDAMAEMLADDICDDDRRRVVSGGITRGRDAQMASLRAIVDVGVKNNESFVIATRGERLALSRARISGGDQYPEAFGLELLTIVEVDTDNRITAGVSFDLDDFDAAIEELDARYLAGEAAAHAHTWSLVTGAYDGFNRRDHAGTTPDWVNIDHRRGAAFASGDMIPYIEAAWDDSPDTRIYIAAVHRLSDVGAVVTHVAQGISQGGFDAEWRDINILTVDGTLVNRSELFDASDLAAALARFDELTAPD